MEISAVKQHMSIEKNELRLDAKKHTGGNNLTAKKLPTVHSAVNNSKKFEEKHHAMNSAK